MYIISAEGGVAQAYSRGRSRIISIISDDLGIEGMLKHRVIKAEKTIVIKR